MSYDEPLDPQWQPKPYPSRAEPSRAYLHLAEKKRWDHRESSRLPYLTDDLSADASSQHERNDSIYDPVSESGLQ